MVVYFSQRSHDVNNGPYMSTDLSKYMSCALLQIAASENPGFCALEKIEFFIPLGLPFCLMKSSGAAPKRAETT